MSSYLKTAQQIYADFGTGNIPGILDQVADDVVWEEGAVDRGIPWLRPGRGKGHVAGFFEVVAREFDFSRFEVKQLFAAGSEVIVHCSVAAKIRSTGKSFEDGFEMHWWRFGDDGKVAGFRHVVDSHSHWLASRK